MIVNAGQLYFLAVFAIAICTYFVRQTLLRPKGKVSAEMQLGVGGARRILSPTEIAYLTKEGDDGFALLVLLLDVMHRELKDKLRGGQANADTILIEGQKSYELALRKAAGGSLKEWSLRKVEGAIGSPKKDPVRFVMKLPALYKYSRRIVEETIKDLFRDPRNIKKFVSVPGLMRLAADIGATGYKVTLANELKQNLTRDGYLASDEQRNRCLGQLVTVFLLCEGLLLLATLYTIAVPLHAWLIFGSALFAAFVVRLVMALREFIPLYSELAQALTLVQKKNMRIKIVGTILGAMTLILNILSGIVFLVLLGLISLILCLTQTVTTFDTVLMLMAQILAQMLAFSCLIDARKLTFGEMPTRSAREAIDALKKQYKQEDTLPALKAMLSESDYGVDVSYLIALYGLESLLLI